RGRRERHLRRHCRGGEGGGERPLEEAAPRKRMPHRFLTSGNAHAKPPSGGRSGPPGARLALPTTMRNRQRREAGGACNAGQIPPASAAAVAPARWHCEDAHPSEGGLAASATLE